MFKYPKAIVKGILKKAPEKTSRKSTVCFHGESTYKVVGSWFPKI